MRLDSLGILICLGKFLITMSALFELQQESINFFKIDPKAIGIDSLEID